jgi:hypothetical protein
MENIKTKNAKWKIKTANAAAWIELSTSWSQEQGVYHWANKMY